MTIKNAHTYFQMPLEWGLEIKGQYENKSNRLKYTAMTSLAEEIQACFLMDKSYLSLLTNQLHVRLTLANLSGRNKEEASFYNGNKFMFPLQHL